MRTTDATHRITEDYVIAQNGFFPLQNFGKNLTFVLCPRHNSEFHSHNSLSHIRAT